MLLFPSDQAGNVADGRIGLEVAPVLEQAFFQLARRGRQLALCTAVGMPPSVSVPTTHGHMPAASAMAGPELEPLAERQLRMLVYCFRLVLPRITAPAGRQLRIQQRSSAAHLT